MPRNDYSLGVGSNIAAGFPTIGNPQLFRKSKLRYRDELVHESFDLDGRLGYMTAAALQYPFRDIDHYLAKQERYSDLMARRWVEQGRSFSWHQLVSHPCFTFVKMYVGRKGCLDGCWSHFVWSLRLLHVHQICPVSGSFSRGMFRRLNQVRRCLHLLCFPINLSNTTNEDPT
ncbi:MAG: hypothetical protein QM771_04555 [Nitrospira sp.]